jgi:hypothetical protein
MRKQILYISSAVLFTSILLGGCNNPNKHAYSYSYEQRFITITTEPSNAKVTLVQPFGQPSVSLGKTPLNSFPVAVMMRLKSENIRVTPQEYAMHLGNAVVRIEHEGYESYFAPLNTHPSGTATHHIKLRPLAK